MFCISLLVLTAVFVNTVSSQSFSDSKYRNSVNLTFHDKTLECVIRNKGVLLLPQQCHMFLYVNNKPLFDTPGKEIAHKYTALLRVTARCGARCTNDDNIDAMELVINETVFIGMCAGAAVVLVLLVVAIVCGVKHCRTKYRQIPQDNVVL